MKKSASGKTMMMHISPSIAKASRPKQNNPKTINGTRFSGGGVSVILLYMTVEKTPKMVGNIMNRKNAYLPNTSVDR